jgi:hypothetical protein
MRARWLVDVTRRSCRAAAVFFSGSLCVPIATSSEPAIGGAKWAEIQAEKPCPNRRQGMASN